VEHLASLRIIPGVHVYRPADVIETAECWELALQYANGPSILALSRQNLPTLRTDAKENKSAHGAYVISDCKGAPQVIIMATGSEVEIAVAAQKLLLEMGVAARVVSVPSLEHFAAQDADYRRSILPKGVLRAVVEAAHPMAWDKYLGEDGLFFGMTSFGASAPSDDLYKHFGITPTNIATKIREKLKV
jgi:transketolase